MDTFLFTFSFLHLPAFFLIHHTIFVCLFHQQFFSHWKYTFFCFKFLVNPRTIHFLNQQISTKIEELDCLFDERVNRTVNEREETTPKRKTVLCFTSLYLHSFSYVMSVINKVSSWCFSYAFMHSKVIKKKISTLKRGKERENVEEGVVWFL